MGRGCCLIALQHNDIDRKAGSAKLKGQETLLTFLVPLKLPTYAVRPASWTIRSKAVVSWIHQALQCRRAQQIFTVNEPMWRCVRQLARQDHQLILLSNINAIHCPWIFTAYPEFSYFEHKVLSFEIGALKPEFAIYQYAINTYQLDPAAIVYIDDQPQNIISGKELGFQCWQYDLNNHQAFQIWLEKTLTGC